MEQWRESWIDRSSTSGDGRKIPRCDIVRILWVLGYNQQSLRQHKYNVSCVAKTKTYTKKKTIRSSQGRTQRVQSLRIEYWQQVTQVNPENLVFIDEMGVLLGLTRTHARSPHPSKVHEFKPFYRQDDSHWCNHHETSCGCDDLEWLDEWQRISSLYPEVSASSTMVECCNCHG